MPSVIRPAGTVSSIQAKAAISVGEIAKPDRKRNAASAANPSTNGSGSISSPSASIPSRNRTAFGGPEAHRTDDHAGHQAADRPDAQHQPGPGRGAELVRQRHGGHLGAAEHGSHGDGARDQRGQHLPRHRGACVPAAGRGGGRLGVLLADQERGAGEGRGHRGGEPGERVHRGGQRGHQGRADDEDHLVDHRLEGEGGEEVALVLDQVRPAGPHGGADLGQPGTGHGGEQVRPRRRPPRLDGGHHPDQPEGEEARRHRQHPALAEPVDEPRLEDRERRVRDEERRGDGAGQSRRSRSGRRPAARCRG